MESYKKYARKLKSFNLNINSFELSNELQIENKALMIRRMNFHKKINYFCTLFSYKNFIN